MKWGQLIFVILFFGVVIVLIFLAFYGSLKERNKKKALDFEQEKIRQTTKNDRLIIMIKLGFYINFLEEFLKDYDPLKGNISLGQVNTFGANLINEILSSKELKDIFKDEVRKEELKEHLETLKTTKPSNWMNVKYESFNILKEKISVLMQNPENKKIVEEVKNNYEIKFT